MPPSPEARQKSLIETTLDGITTLTFIAS